MIVKSDCRISEREMNTQMLTKNKTIKLVIVEDYKLTRVGLVAALNKLDYIDVIGEADDGHSAIELVSRLKPDVVLMDLGLSGMNGIEATQKIKECCNSANIIVLTSHDHEEEVMAALGAGAKGYCLKDIDPTTLASVIKSVSEGACWFDPGVATIVLNQFPKPKDTTLLPQGSYSDARAQLTEREIEVLRLLVQGKSNTEIAAELIVSVHTAKAHVCSILQKLCVDDRVQAAVKAIKENII